MASYSGTFTAAQQVSAVLFLRPKETVRVTLTVTGTATIVLQESIGPAQALRTLATLTATGTTDYANTTLEPMYVRLACAAVAGSTAYTLADITGDQVLVESPMGGWYRADGTLVAKVTDEGFVGPVLTPVAQGGSVNVFDYMTPEQIADVTAGTRALSHTTAVQAAIAAMGAYDTLVWPKGFYNVSDLEVSGDGQRWVGEGGYVILYKNSNGPILTVPVGITEFACEFLQFRGESASYTGNNIELYAGDAVFFRCGSRDAAGFALYGEDVGHLSINGQRDVWATATVADFDIHVKRATYAEFSGIRTTQSGANGGFKFTDCGSQFIYACQFGKYEVLADASPAGVNGGTIFQSRILGPIVINLSNSVMVGCQLGSSATLTYGTGTSGHVYIPGTNSNGTITNNGTASSLILQQRGSGATIELMFGGNAGSAASVATLEVTPSDGLFEFPAWSRFKNGYGIRFEQLASVGALGAFLAMTTGDTLQLQNLVSNEFIRLGTTGASSKVDFDINGAIRGAFSVNGHELASFTTAQRDALTGVVAGTFIFNDDTNKLNFYTGSAWEAVTSA